jgi:hypothetical protein
MAEKESQLESRSHSYFSKFGSIDNAFFDYGNTVAATAIVSDVAKADPLINNAKASIDLIESCFSRIHKLIIGRGLLRMRIKPLGEIKANYSVCEYI